MTGLTRILSTIRRLKIKGLYKTILFNLKVFDVKTALKIPVVLSGKVNVWHCHKGCIEFKDCTLRPSLLSFGFLDLEYGINQPSHLSIKGKLIVRGSGFHIFAPGLRLNIEEQGTLEIDECFSISHEARIDVTRHTKIGRNFMGSYDVTIMDTDWHYIFQEGETINPPKGITIGNDVWVSTRCTILKGAKIPDNCVIGAGSIVSKPLGQGDAIYAGVPAKSVKSDIAWSRNLYI